MTKDSVRKMLMASHRVTDSGKSTGYSPGDHFRGATKMVENATMPGNENETD